MKLSTYGMWENPRLDLVNALFKDLELNCSMEQIDKALLEPVITKIIDTSYSYQQKLQIEQPQLSLKEKTLATYKVALSTMLSTLAESLDRPEELLHSYVEKFISESLALSNQNIDYLMQLATISRQIKINGVTELYGDNFSMSYPILAQTLPFNDVQLIEKATKAVTEAIHKDCPTEIYPIMAEHIKYMNEITAQKLADPQFAEKFKSETGMTMEEFKSQIRLSKFTEIPSVSLVGHFKMRSQLKETVEEKPATTFSGP
ncbi:hypothetical protein DGG96_15455 [Legionella qingyii]|uniref:Uncharacterized protein n=1 Tax=Legionella qingyii TaxID=2184757 RepID=A0A317TYP9_9GAMM|nr:hypothetical protein [Legionella qingyii]PWY54774.1 hypothetical protein DGG96_15455 [Legionella qingyii]RUR20848.1 hypothetical protein ELY20_14390 [Legionella qingyii]